MPVPLSSEDFCKPDGSHAAAAPSDGAPAGGSKSDALPSSQPKFCKDCKHFTAAGALGFYGVGVTWPDWCRQPPERDLIHGRTTPTDPHRMRSEQGACKPEALLWEEKPAPAPVAELREQAIREFGPIQSPGAWIEQHIYPQRPWWRFWQ